jgi:hypothetical protein
MFYMEFLFVRKVLYWLAGLLAAAVALVSWALASSAHGIPHHPAGFVPVEALLAGATLVAAIIAMIFACALARQNDGHLPLVWTRPVSRQQYVFTVTLVHLAGIAVAFVMSLAAALSVFAIFGALSALTMAGGPADAPTMGRMFLFPLAWYGLVMAITASTRGGAGFMAFGAWIVGSVLVGFDSSHLFGGAAGIVINVIDHINPLYYFSGHFDDSGRNQSMVANVDVAMAGLAAIAVAGYAAAIAQWRRLEA